MIRKKLVAYSLLLLAAALSTLALIGSPAPASACIPICTGNICPGGKVQATCDGKLICSSFCAE